MEVASERLLVGMADGVEQIAELAADDDRARRATGKLEECAERVQALAFAKVQRAGGQVAERDGEIGGDAEAGKFAPERIGRRLGAAGDRGHGAERLVEGERAAKDVGERVESGGREVEEAEASERLAVGEVDVGGGLFLGVVEGPGAAVDVLREGGERGVDERGAVEREAKGVPLRGRDPGRNRRWGRHGAWARGRAKEGVHGWK